IPVLLLALLASPDGGATQLATRDASSGAAVQAQVEYSIAGATRVAAAGGELRRLDAGSEPVIARVRAEGHHDLELWLTPGAAPTTVLLEPITPPAQFTRLAQRLEGDPEARAMQGFVRRAHDAAPITGATVSLEGNTTRTDAEGYFEIL